jgi:hypothetical protein
LFPQPEFQKATDSIDRIAKKTEDKAMYDTREKALRDQQWILNAVKREAREEGEIRLIQTLQEILGVEVSEESSLQGKSIDGLQALTAELRELIQNRS